MNSRKLPFAITVLVLALLAMAGIGLRGGLDWPGSHANAAQLPPAAGTVAGLPDFTSLVERYGPAVVNINTLQKLPETGEFPGAMEGDPIYEFFKRFGIPLPDSRAVPRQGVGSGFIVSPDGYVLTNGHVVADASEVIVKLVDKREFKAKVIGADRRTDVALLKIDATGLPAVKIGDPQKVRVGEWVAAIGSPFGFDNSVTAGIVSAKARWIPDGGSYVPFIQTDVAVNPGNSGGPLFNMNGEVIGINSAIYSRTGGYMGVSFAIPIDVAMKVKEDLQKHGKVSRGKLGVTIQPVSRELARSFGLDRPVGALVNAVEPGGPADKAGLMPGDIILSVDGQAVNESHDLPRLIGERSPGQTVRLELWRKGARTQVQARLAEFADVQAAREPSPQGAPQGKLGLAVRPLSEQERRRLGSDGVLVENVSGPAARAGVRPGDIILALNNQSVASPEQLQDMAERSRGPVALLIQRGDARVYVAVEPQ